MIDNRIFVKIFMWMFVGLAITFGFGFLVSLNENIVYNVFSKYYLFFILIEIVVVIVLSARINKLSSMTAKTLFCLYSGLTGFTFSSIFIVYNITSIIYVFSITSILFLIFAIIGNYTKVNLTKLGTYLFMGLIGIILCTIINVFVGSESFNLGITILSLLIFIAYIAYDIQIIKRNLYKIDNEDNFAIFGALQLYLDFINIFLKLLRLFGRNSD